MKQISTLLSILAILAIGVLYYLHFSHSDGSKKQISVQKKGDSTHFRIAYFDIDSLQAKFNSFKDAEEKLKSRENSSKGQLAELNIRYQKRLKELQEKAATMTQSEGEAAQRELAQRQQEFQQKEMELDQELKKMQMDIMTDLRKKVEEYLKKYNQQKGYAYIFSYEPGFIMYYKDTLYDITGDLIKGLNAEYESKKKD